MTDSWYFSWVFRNEDLFILCSYLDIQQTLCCQQDGQLERDVDALIEK